MILLFFHLKWIGHDKLLSSHMKVEEKLERIPLTASFLVPDISEFKEVQNGTESGSPIIKTLAKAGKLVISKVCMDVRRHIMKSTLTY